MFTRITDMDMLNSEIPAVELVKEVSGGFSDLVS